MGVNHIQGRKLLMLVDDHEYVGEAEAGLALCAAQILQQHKGHGKRTVPVAQQPGIQRPRACLVSRR